MPNPQDQLSWRRRYFKFREKAPNQFWKFICRHFHTFNKLAFTMNNFIFTLLPECMRSFLFAILIEVIGADGFQCFPESTSRPWIIS